MALAYRIFRGDEVKRVDICLATDRPYAKTSSIANLRGAKGSLFSSVTLTDVATISDITEDVIITPWGIQKSNIPYDNMTLFNGSTVDGFEHVGVPIVATVPGCDGVFVVPMHIMKLHFEDGYVRDVIFENTCKRTSCILPPSGGTVEKYKEVSTVLNDKFCYSPVVNSSSVGSDKSYCGLCVQPKANVPFNIAHTQLVVADGWDSDGKTMLSSEANPLSFGTWWARSLYSSVASAAQDVAAKAKSIPGDVGIGDKPASPPQ